MRKLPTVKESDLSIRVSTTPDIRTPTVKQSLAIIYSEMNNKEVGPLKTRKQEQFCKEIQMKDQKQNSNSCYLSSKRFNSSRKEKSKNEKSSKSAHIYATNTSQKERMSFSLLEGEVGVLLPANQQVASKLEEIGSQKAKLTNQQLKEKKRFTPLSSRPVTPNPLASIDLTIPDSLPNHRSIITLKSSHPHSPSRNSISQNVGMHTDLTGTSVKKENATHRTENTSVFQGEDEVKIEYNQVAILPAGKSFGELALIKNKPRAATIRCLSECHFAVVDRYDYKKVLGKIEQKRINHMTDYLQSLPYFKKWTRHAIAKLQYFFTKKEYSRQQIVFSEGDPAEQVFLIMNGEYEAYTSIMKTEKKEIDVEKIIEHSYQQKSKRQKGNYQQTRGFHARIAMQHTGVTKNFQKIRIALMMNGQLMGDQDILRSLANDAPTTRRYTVQCISQKGELLIIKKTVRCCHEQEFFRRLKLADETWKLISESCKLKDTHFIAKVKNEAQQMVQKGIQEISIHERKPTKMASPKKASIISDLNLRDAFVNFNYPDQEFKYTIDKRRKAPLRERLSSARKPREKDKLSPQFIKHPEMKYLRKLNVQNINTLIKKEEEIQRKLNKKESFNSQRSVQEKKKEIKKHYFNKKRASGDTAMVLQVAHYCSREPETDRALEYALDREPVNMKQTKKNSEEELLSFKTPGSYGQSAFSPQTIRAKSSSGMRSTYFKAHDAYKFFATETNFRGNERRQSTANGPRKKESTLETNTEQIEDTTHKSIDWKQSQVRTKELSEMRELIKNHSDLSDLNNDFMQSHSKNGFSTQYSPTNVIKFQQPALEVSFSQQNLFKRRAPSKIFIEQTNQFMPFRPVVGGSSKLFLKSKSEENTPNYKNKFNLRRGTAPFGYRRLKHKGYMPQACTFSGKSQLLVKSSTNQQLTGRSFGSRFSKKESKNPIRIL